MLQRNQIDYTGQNIYVGFDVHLKSWKVSVMTDKMKFKPFSQDPNPEALVNYLKKNFPGGIYNSAYEAGFCGYWIHHRLLSLGVSNIVVNAADIPTTHKEKVAKEDKRDSRKIVRSLRSGELTPIFVPSVETMEDRSLLRARSKFVKESTRNKCRIKSYLHFNGIDVKDIDGNKHWSNKFLKWLEGVQFNQDSGKSVLTAYLDHQRYLRNKLSELTKKVRQLSQQERYLENVRLLCTIPGVGLIVSMTFLTELGDMSRFGDVDKYCSYIGIVPTTSSSGESDRTGGLTSRNNTEVLSKIIESAWVTVRCDPGFRSYFHKLCLSMENNEAIIRVAKRLAKVMRSVIKNKTGYVASE
jgi:transposase